MQPEENIADSGSPPVAMKCEPLAYHNEIIQYLQLHEKELWAWFASDRLRAQNNESVRLELLKATYRIEREQNPVLYGMLDEVMAAFKIDVPATVYQSTGGGNLNASLAYIPGEIHLILTGAVLTTLTPAELRSVIAHELMHYVLFDSWPDYSVASKILSAMSHDAQVQSAHIATCRLFGLYTEICCDRAAYQFTRDVAATVAALVKMETGTPDVSAESYLRQAQEILAKGHLRSEGVTHPEAFVRARAVELWATDQQNATDEIRRIIEGAPTIEDLDLIGQQKIAGITRRLIQSLLRYPWILTDTILGHAKLFFDNFTPASQADADLVRDLAGCQGKLRDYYCYVLLDFAVADRDLEEAPLAAALLLSDELKLGERFREIAAKELNMRKKQMEELENKASTIVAKASEVVD